MRKFVDIISKELVLCSLELKFKFMNRANEDMHTKLKPKKIDPDNPPIDFDIEVGWQPSRIANEQHLKRFLRAKKLWKKQNNDI